MKIILNLTIAFSAFLVTAIIAGQIIMRGQGDTTESSMKYGFLYVLYGCGIPQTFKALLSGEFPKDLIAATLIQISVALSLFIGLELKQKKVNQKRKQ
jgi:hypothetical protein